jgi:hypothetical protein
MNMVSQENNKKTYEINIDIVWVTKNMPNTWLSCVIFETITIWTLSAQFKTLVESNDSCHLTKKIIHRFITQTLFLAIVFPTSCTTPQTFPQPQNWCLFISIDFTDFGCASHMPPIDLCFQTSPKLAQKKLSQICPLNLPQGSTIPPKWSELVPSWISLSSSASEP